jgi:hypothetical protein
MDTLESYLRDRLVDLCRPSRDSCVSVRHLPSDVSDGGVEALSCSGSGIGPLLRGAVPRLEGIWRRLLSDRLSD